MTSKDKTAEKLVQSIRKTKTTSANTKTAAVSASAMPKAAPQATANASKVGKATADAAPFIRRRVWPD